MRNIALFILCAGAVCFAQEARIMIVEKPDSERLSGAYRDYQAAKKRWEDVKIYVAKKYTNPDGTKVIEGWEKVQFSADFRALVPDNSQFASHSGCLYGWQWPYGGIMNTTVTGSTGATSNIANAGTYLSGDGRILAPQGSGGAKIIEDLHVNPDGVATDLTTKEPKRP